MTPRSGKSCSGFTFYEFAICAAVAAVLTGLLLTRVLFYRERAERVAVQQLVGTLRTTLQLHASQLAATQGERGLRRLLEENPLDWLARKPDNYLGEYYSPDLEKMPTGNWVFDRRDKCLIYLLNSNKKLYLNASKLLKFKVEYAPPRRQAAGTTNMPAEVSTGVELNQLTGQHPVDTDE
jgi:general secretion pathway protein G